MKKIKILLFNKDIVLEDMVKSFSSKIKCDIIRKNHFKSISFTNEKIVFAFTVDSIGSNVELMRFIKRLKDNNIVFNDSFGVILVNSNNSLYTKTLSQQVVFLLNKMNLSFIGQPMIEVIADYMNYETWNKLYKDKSLKKICEIQIEKLAKRFFDFDKEKINNPKILAIHSSSYQTSNTLMLWNMIKKNLAGYTINEIEVEDNKIVDCNGCPFETCLHYAKKNSCYYGGVVIENILPAIEESDYIIWICPNYNDSISAKLMAVINRMTVLYRRVSLHEKVIFSVIISGNSGSDSVAKHLISALNLNKGLILPPNFSIMEIANDSGKIIKVKDIEKHAYNFAKNIMDY
ncbi:MAG: NAD(P)H-dependent oxidoreductase [Bacillota bacterium]|nr:NAD(P)H-dependent oxidoreductase [Bacillota bacterium]